ncbi:DNA-directed RNA polymerase, mitochondrial isoform X2 [Ixodes scapularis]
MGRRRVLSGKGDRLREERRCTQQREWVRNLRKAAVASTSTASSASDSLAKEHIARLESRRREQNQRCKRRRRANATDDDRATEGKRKRKARRRLHSTPAEQFPGVTARFRREFVENLLSVTCAVCTRLWFAGDVSTIGGVSDEKKRESGACALRQCIEYSSAAPFVRLPEAAQQQKLVLESTPVEQLYPSFDALNILALCPWRINKPVLDLVVEVFLNKGSQELDIPMPPSECPAAPKFQTGMTKLEKAKVSRERMVLKRKRAEMYSLWCDALYKLSIANHFKDRVFWFPHNMDFRGRVYPCPPHFNHLGSDVVRGILLFARGEPLGEKGLDWLKVHLINLTGLKKREPASERLKFANKMLPEILDSADNPMTGRRWWASSEEPWQTLACCREVAAAVRSPDPRRYVCHLPVHQDGSCNGLQHYAALGRDAHGARQVNLLPEDRPQDVYSGVAAMVERERTKDAANGVAIAQVLEGFIKRKVVKQTVMTVVYGVTRFGAHLQIMKQLKDLEDFPQEHCWAASHYLVQRTFLSLQEMFTATREIQEWLTSSAKLISQVCGQPVEWVTPLGLPVVQPYHKNASVRSPVSFGDRIPQDYWSSFEMYQRPNVMKQKNAFPPNFIHSLDSSHMMLTALFCHKAGIQFVSVHDCFWTHPNTVDIMNKMCREQFVALHSEPILENLSQYLVGKFGYRDSELLRDGSLGELAKQKLNRILTQIPQKGSFELKNVLDSVYFFS